MTGQVFIFLLGRVGFLFFYILVLAVSAQADQIPSIPDDKSLEYLSRFGYLGSKISGNAIVEQLYIAEAVANFQSMAGINVTGVVDGPTLEAMSWCRCGNMDKTPDSKSRRKKRYTPQGSKWNKNDLTYRITKYTTDLPKAEVDVTIQRAFDVWADVTPLTFTRKATGDIDIEITFVTGEHGDGNPFDGPGRVLAHAYFPRYGGDAHFDDAEKFTIRSYRGINLLQVAAHEFGHSLGLSHSKIKSALMAPFYRGYSPSFKLHADDIAGIQSIYGKPVVISTTTGSPSGSSAATTPQTATTAGPTSGVPDFCEGKVDVVFLSKGKTFMFKGDYYALLDDNAIAATYPRRIADDWDGLPGNLDAATTMSYTGFIYFFKGENYWVFDDLKKIGGPMAISATFINLPSSIDTAMEWSNRRVYIFKDGNYYRLNVCLNGVDTGYPLPLSRWGRLSSPVDAAFVWKNRKTYFFKGDKYYRTDYGYPQDTASIWLGCSQAGRLQRDVSIKRSKLPFDEDNEIDDLDESNLKSQAGGAGGKGRVKENSHPMGNDAIGHDNPTEHNQNIQWKLTGVNNNPK